MNIVLIGYRGSGKSATGRLLAEELGWAYVDTDTLIEQRCGMTIRDLFADHAEEGFREAEGRVVAEVADLDRHVVSTGGGVVLRPDNGPALKRTGKLVWLAAPPEVLWERIKADTQRLNHRPSADPNHGLQDVRSVLRQREPLYAGWADFVVDTANQSPEAVAAEIIGRLQLPRQRPTPHPLAPARQSPHVAR